MRKTWKWQKKEDEEKGGQAKNLKNSA